MSRLPYEKPRITHEEEFAAMADPWACAFNPAKPGCGGGKPPSQPNGTCNRGANDGDCYPVHNS